MMIEKQIYNGWAFSDDEQEKRRMNRLIYSELSSKYKLSVSDYHEVDNESKEVAEADVVITTKHFKGRNVCTIHKAPDKLTDMELLLIADNGNLCFGGEPGRTRCSIFTD